MAALSIEEKKALGAFYMRTFAMFTNPDLDFPLNGEALRRAVYAMLACEKPDDANMRFLKVHKLDVDAAHSQFLAHLRWRSSVHVDDDIMRFGEVGAARTEIDTTASPEARKDAEGFMKQLRLGKSFVRGTDKHGRPIVVVRVRLHKGADQTVSSMERFGTFQIETTRLMMGPNASSALLLFDMNGFGLANMDYTPLKFLISTLESYYPDGLGDVVLHRAPWIFQLFWKVIKNMVPAEFESHIHFTKTVQDLEKFMDKSSILKEQGGEDEWTFEYEEPTTSGEWPGALEQDKLKERESLVEERLQLGTQFEESTRAWIKGVEDGSDVSGIQEERNVLSDKLVASYWRLDPLNRSRSLYDKWGWIKSPCAG